MKPLKTVGHLFKFAVLIGMLLGIGLRLGNYKRSVQMARDLELARSVQLALLPQSAAMRPNLDFAGECIPAWEVGGDFYDVFGAPGGPASIVVADVAGKGLSAALLTSLLHGAVRSVSWISSADGYALAAQQMNELLCTRTVEDRFASLFWCQYDPPSSMLRYVNAGHLPPMLIRKNHDGGFAFRRLEEGGPVLGLIPGACYREGHVSVKAGELLILFSDGITEAANQKEEEYGEERLSEVIRNSWERPPQEICQRVLKSIQTFLGDLNPHDDQTLVVVRLKVAGQPQATALNPAQTRG
jgi:phosphoserine phosphatase RsbU/P